MPVEIVIKLCSVILLRRSSRRWSSTEAPVAAVKCLRITFWLCSQSSDFLREGQAGIFVADVVLSSSICCTRVFLNVSSVRSGAVTSLAVLTNWWPISPSPLRGIGEAGRLYIFLLTRGSFTWDEARGSSKDDALRSTIFWRRLSARHVSLLSTTLVRSKNGTWEAEVKVVNSLPARY